MKASSLVVMAGLLAASGAARAEGTRRLALVVGSNQGGDGRVPLRFAETDAANMDSVLQAMGGVAPSDSLLLLNPDPDAIVAALDELAATVAETRAAGQRSEVVFYYSGHSDEDGLLPGGGELPYPALKRELGEIDSDVQLVILDSCASGALIRQKGGVMRPPFLVDASVDVRGRAILTSSTGDEAAQESDRVGGSFFTHYLVSGLRGAADTSRDGDVTLSEVYQFAYDETLARTERSLAGPQHPTWDIQLAGTGDLVVTSVLQTEAGLHLGEGLEGRLYVRDAAGRLVAELYKPAEREVVLGLEPGKYTALLDAAGALSEAVFEVRAGDVLEGAALSFRRVSGEAVATRGGAAFTEVPFAVQVMPGFEWPETDGPTRQQWAVGLPVASADALRGAQISFGANVVRGRAEGVQAAIGANVAGEMRGLQTSVGPSVAGEIDGVQGALVNVAGRARGLQLGLVNVGRRVDGLQLGLVNIADDADESIGLVVINRAGYNHLSLSARDAELGELGVTWGGKHLYTTIRMGLRPEAGGSGQTSLGLGLGAHLTFGRPYVDLDVVGMNYYQDWVMASSVLVRGRALFGFEVFRHLGFFVGPTLTLAPLYDAETPYQTSAFAEGVLVGTNIPAWFGGVAGVRF